MARSAVEPNRGRTSGASLLGSNHSATGPPTPPFPVVLRPRQLPPPGRSRGDPARVPGTSFMLDLLNLHPSEAIARRGNSNPKHVPRSLRVEHPTGGVLLVLVGNHIMQLKTVASNSPNFLPLFSFRFHTVPFIHQVLVLSRIMISTSYAKPSMNTLIVCSATGSTILTPILVHLPHLLFAEAVPHTCGETPQIDDRMSEAWILFCSACFLVSWTPEAPIHSEEV